MRNELQNDFQQIGGKHAVSWKAAAIFFPIFIIGIPFLESTYQDFEDFKLWTYASLLGIIPCILVFFIAEKTYFADRVANPKRPRDVICFGFIVGAIKGLSLEFLAFQFNLHEGNILEMLLIRGFNSALLGAAFMPFVSLASVVSERIARERAALIEQLAFLSTRTSQQAEIAYLIEHETLDKLNEELTSMLESTKIRFSMALANPEKINPQELASMLTETGEELVRPLSHTLYKEAEKREIKYRFLPTLKFASTHFAFDYKIVTLIYALTSLKELVLAYGVGEGVLIMSARACAVFTSLFLAQSLYEEFRSRNFYLFAPFTVFTVTFYLLIENRVNAFLNVPNDGGKVGLEAVWLTIVILLVTFVKSAAHSTSIELDKGRDFISQRELITHRRTLAERQNYKNFSKFLHGVLHSRLNASALAISLAAESGDKAKINEEVNRALELLDLKLESGMVHKPVDIESEIELIFSKWDGLMEVSINDFTLESISDFQLYGISLVLTEALSNAFRHGRATSLCVALNQNPSGDISLTVSDNGVGVISKIPGLGSSYFSEIAGTHWQLSTLENGEGAELIMLIPTKEQNG